MAATPRNGVKLPWKTVDELKSRYRFTDLQSFLDLLYVNLEVRMVDDISRAAGLQPRERSSA